MTEHVPFDGNNTDQAVLLLDAAEQLGVDVREIKVSKGGFVAPAEVVEKAFGKQKSESSTGPEQEKAPAKKAAAKKTTSKKAE